MVTLENALLWGAVAIGAAGLAFAFAIVFPGRRVDARRRLQTPDAGGGALAHTATGATTLVTRMVAARPRVQRWAYALERAGIRRPLPEVIIMVGAGVLLGFATGMLVSGPLLGLIFSVVLLLLLIGVVAIRADLRRKKFTDQLDDVLQLLATNLRAGHSMLQALSGLATDIDEPARSELTRAVNEVRVGRDLGEAIEETASRMASEDFAWVAQAVSINRRVGGNLADVLESISVTIRERNQIRRQVRSLSAEGRLSGYILVGMPIVVALILSLLNPLYFEVFTQTAAGLTMLAACVALMTLGSLWLWRLVQVEY